VPSSLISWSWKQTGCQKRKHKWIKWPVFKHFPDTRPVRLAYQPPASSTFLSEQTSHQQPASSTLLSEQTSISHQPLTSGTLLICCLLPRRWELSVTRTFFVVAGKRQTRSRSSKSFPCARFALKTFADGRIKSCRPLDSDAG
jgi:hypothetical protein